MEDKYLEMGGRRSDQKPLLSSFFLADRCSLLSRSQEHGKTVFLSPNISKLWLNQSPPPHPPPWMSWATEPQIASMLRLPLGLLTSTSQTTKSTDWHLVGASGEKHLKCYVTLKILCFHDDDVAYRQRKDQAKRAR